MCSETLPSPSDKPELRLSIGISQCVQIPNIKVCYTKNSDSSGTTHTNQIVSCGSSQRIKIYFGNFVFIAVLNDFLLGL